MGKGLRSPHANMAKRPHQPPRREEAVPSSEHIYTEDCHTSQGMGGRDKIELKQRLLEPKWHWSVRYCCNFLCAKHGYKQITRHPISILFAIKCNSTSQRSHFTSLTLVAKRTRMSVSRQKPLQCQVLPSSQCQYVNGLHDIVKAMQYETG